MYFRLLMLAVACAAIVSVTSHSYAEEMARQIVQPYYAPQADEQAALTSPYYEGFDVKKERITEGLKQEYVNM